MAFRASACMLSEVLDNLLFFLGNLLLRLWVHCVPFSSTGTFLYGAMLGLQARIFYGDTAITVGWGNLLVRMNLPQLGICLWVTHSGVWAVLLNLGF